MTVLNDKQILELCRNNGLIDSYAERQIRNRCVNGTDPVISWGLSSYGYDARLADEFMIVDTSAQHIDPKARTPFVVDNFRNQNDSYTIHPGEMVLARTVERFKMPDDVMAICVGKSTYARCGLIVNVTPLEPGWEGHVTLELSNTASLPIVVYPHEGICQFVFYRGERPSVTYSDRAGKYQGQTGVTLARV